MINEDRHIRIFISSTFRDMQDERDILVKKIFPQLRKMCEERAVTWTEVDLRWGITTEQAAEGKVLPLCLTEIHRCRPFFIGLLGERYGWVPDLNSIPSDLFDSQPWLKNHLQQSVTELEILYGIFSSESVHGQAYFYFRNPKFLETLPTERRQNFVSENTEAKQNLERLKMKIRCAFEERICVLRENYSTPEELGEWILNDFTTLINKLYPKDKIPSPLDQEAARHETYARSKRFGFVGREDLLYHLKEYITKTNKPLFLYGEPGCGKSALLAEWVARWQKDNPEDFIIQHYIGATLDSADWQGIVHRILIELKQAFTIIDDIPIHPDALLNALTEWTVKTNSLRRIILVIDGLNQIADASEASQLRWLPVFFPSNFHVLLSTGRCENLDVLRERGWTEINVPLFSKEDVSAVTLAYFKVYSKTLPEAIIKKLNVTPATRNALFLRSVLDELRQFGLYEKLFEKADVYLSASNLPELFDHILTRWHDDFGKDTEHPDLVQLSLCYIACSRFGLAETELLDLLGRNGEPLPHRFWTPFSIAAENSILLRARLLNFGHDYLRVAVQKRWLDNSQTKNKIHLRMACYFAESTIGSIRILDELPWQLRQTSAWEKLYTLLSNVTFYSALYHHRHSDVLSAWSDIERESSHQMINTYVSVLQNPSDFPDDILDVVANHLDVTGHWPELIIFRGKLVEYYIRSGKINRLATSLLSQASLHVQKGNLDEGLHLLSRLDSLVWFSQEPWILQDFLRIKSMILWQKGELDEAMDILEAREQFCRKVPDFNHQLAGTLVHKSFIRQLQGDQAVAENLLSEALRISRESGDMHSYQAVVGEIGLLLLKEGNLNGAMDKFSEQERICRELGDMVSLAGCLGNQGTLLSMVGKRTDALNMFKEMENLANKIQHQVLYHVSRSEQAQQIYNTNSVEDALTMNGEAVNFFRIHGLTERLATSLFVQGHIYSFMLDPEKADKTYQEGIIQLQKISSTREVADMMYKAGNHYRAVFLSYQRPLKGFLTFNFTALHESKISAIFSAIIFL